MLIFPLLGVALATTAGLSADSRHVCAAVVEEYAGDLALVDATGRVTQRVSLGLKPHEVTLGPGGSSAYVSLFGIADYDHRIGTPGRAVDKVDLKSGRVVQRYSVPASLVWPHGVALRPHSYSQLFTNAEIGGDTMLVFDEKTGRLLRRFVLQPGAHNFVFSPDGRSIYVFSGTGVVDRYDARNGQRLARIDLQSPVRGLRYSAHASLLVSGKGTVFVLSPNHLKLVGKMKSAVPGQLVYLDEWPDGTIVAPSLDDGGVVVFKPRGETRFIPTGKTPVHVQRGADGLAYVTNVDDEHMSIVDPQSLAVRSTGKFDGANGIALRSCAPHR